MKITALTRQLVVGSALAALAAVVIQGCGGGGYGGGAAYNPPPPPPPNPSPTPGPLIHVNFFGGGNGSINMGNPFEIVSGFTQQAHAQVMAFAPGEQIMITNNDTVAHTINVFAAYPTPGPQSTSSAPNGGVFGPGYMSGPISAGNSVGPLTVTNTAGNLFIICGIHFADGMQDGVIVQVGATPGPEATPAPSQSGSGGCKGYGC